jgi:hypothetical protein
MRLSNPSPRRLRDECLNETLFTSLAHARAELTAWKDDYNRVRPHSGLGSLAPSIFATRSAIGTRANKAQICSEAAKLDRFWLEFSAVIPWLGGAESDEGLALRPQNWIVFG